MKSSSCCFYILQEKEENNDIIVLFRHVFLFLYYITLMCLKMIRMCPQVRLGAQPVLDSQGLDKMDSTKEPIIKCSFKFLISV